MWVLNMMASQGLKRSPWNTVLARSTIDAAARCSQRYRKLPHGCCQYAYDGNGMFYSTGNAAAYPQVGLLFIDFETPHRLRVQGKGAAKEAFPGAQLLVRVRPTHIFANCSRYVHKRRKVEASRYKYMPGRDGSAPLALWKRTDFVQNSLPDRDRHEAQAVGPITQQKYVAKVAAGDA